MLDSLFTGLGIDLSDHHVRLAQVTLFGRVKHTEEVVLKEGIVRDEQVVDPQALHGVLAKMLMDKGLDRGRYRTTILVPESRVFSHSMLLDAALKGEERNIRARGLAQKEIPLPFSQARLSFSDGGREDGQTRTTVYAAHRDVFDPLVKSFSHPSLRLKAIEANSKALFRLMMSADQDLKRSGHLLVIVDVGRGWTTVTLYTPAGASLLSRTIPHLDDKEKKTTTGVHLPKVVVDRIIDTLQEIVVFSGQNKREVSRVVFGGVEAQDANLAKRAKTLKIPTAQIGEQVVRAGVTKEAMHRFGAAIGAAMRSASFRGYSYQHNFLENASYEIQKR